MAEFTPAKKAGPKQTEFDVILTAAGDHVDQVIQVIREITGLGLEEAKALVGSAPTTIKESVPEIDAEDMKNRLTEVGATVRLE